jgi:hypothetical protein
MDVVPWYSRYRTPRRGDLGTTGESQAERECERQYVEGTNPSLVKIAQTSRIQPTDSVTLARFEINDAQLRANVAVDVHSAVFDRVNEVPFAERIHEETDAEARALLLVSE